MSFSGQLALRKSTKLWSCTDSICLRSPTSSGLVFRLLAPESWPFLALKLLLRLALVGGGSKVGRNPEGGGGGGAGMVTSLDVLSSGLLMSEVCHTW